MQLFKVPAFRPEVSYGHQMHEFPKWQELSIGYGCILPDIDCPVPARQMPGLLAALSSLQANAQAESFKALHKVSSFLAEEIIRAQAGATEDIERDVAPDFYPA